MWITVDDVIKAAEKNGFEWRTDGTWHEVDIDGYVTAGCVLGQAAVNLGTDGISLCRKLNQLDPIKAPGQKIYRYNDMRAKTYQEAARHLEGILSRYRNKKINVSFKAWKIRTDG